MVQFLQPAELKKITEDLEMAEHRAESARRLQADQMAEDLKRSFQSREIVPETPERINKAVRVAAERGEREILVIRFPSTYCNDGGRRINNFEHDWPNSLEGFARIAFDYYEKELRPLGFTMRAEIMNFPGGMPGDVGLYLRW